MEKRGGELAKARHVHERIRRANARKGISNAKRSVEGIEKTKHRGKRQARKEKMGKELENPTRIK